MLDRLAGNDALRRDLAAALGAGRLAHSLLLCGEKGLGAGFAARCLAADYLYPAGGPQAETVLAGGCGECIEVRGEGASGEIKVDRVREVRRRVFDTALSAAGRVVILYDAQKLNGSSGNALLKIIEEPPDGVLFILTAPSAAAVLPTIRSRCAAYTLAPVSEADCAACLQRLLAGRPAAGGDPIRDPAWLAALYAGEIGRALDVLQDPARAAVLADAVRLAELCAKGQEYPLLIGLAAYETAKKPKKAEPKKPGAAKRGAPARPPEPEPDRLPDTARLLLHDLACIGSAAMRGRKVCGLSPQKAARLAREAENALTALAGNVNRRLVLTNLAIAMAQPG